MKKPAGDPVALTLSIEFQINNYSTWILKYKTTSSVFVTPVGVIRQGITMAIAGSSHINICFWSKKKQFEKVNAFCSFFLEYVMMTFKHIKKINSNSNSTSSH